MRGKKPKSLKLQILEGRKYRVKDTPKLKPLLEKKRAPSWLPKYGKQFWREQFSDLVKYGIIRSIDVPAFCNLCIQYSNIREAEEILSREGLVVNGHRGVRSKHPAVSILKAAADNFHKGCLEFGITPNSRQRIDIDQISDDNYDGSDLLT
jgi:P27 family predicted phage terminase small subunit